MGNESLSIGHLARSTGLSPEALRHYERLGLIRPVGRTATNHRRYDEEARRRLRFIRRAQELGFSLPEIQELLSLGNDPETDLGRVRAIAQARIRDLEARVSDLVRMKEALEALVEACPGHGPRSACPILQALTREET